MEKRTILKIGTAGAVVAGLAYGGVDIFGGGPSGPEGGSAGASAQTAEQYCDTTPYQPDQYQAKVGGNPSLIKQIGGNGTNGTVSFESSNSDETAAEVAVDIAPNNAALATISTIISAETGITPSSVASQASTKFTQMEKNPTIRKDVCEKVVTRVLNTNGQDQIQSQSGKMNIYVGTFSAGSLTGINAIIDPNTEAQEVFTITPAVGAENESFPLQQAISQSWGVTATGEIIQKSDIEGSANENASTGGGGTKSTNPSQASSSAGNPSKGSGGSSPVENKGSAGGAGPTGEGTNTGQSGTGTGTVPSGTAPSSPLPSTPPGAIQMPPVSPPETVPPTSPPETVPPTSPPETVPPTSPPETVPPTTVPSTEKSGDNTPGNTGGTDPGTGSTGNPF